MLTLTIILTTIASVFRLKSNMNIEERRFGELNATNGAAWSLGQYLTSLVEHYGTPFGQHCINLIYAIYLRMTLINVVIFILKYLATGMYMYNFIKNIYMTSRERIKQKAIELEDLQLQIQIVNTKLCVSDAEFTERVELLRRGAERLRRVQDRVRDVIATDDALRRMLDGVACWDTEHDLHVHTTPQEDREFIVDLLKGLKYDQVVIPERQTENMECGEHAQSEPSTPENSVYSSLSDLDVRQDCRVKIVKVTNIYKVASLKHYIKQKKLRRANKQAVLKKKMESIKTLLEDWQKMLNMVINSNMSILNMDPYPIDVSSQEAMGDYSKARESSDSDTDLRNGGNDMLYDEYGLSWAQNPHRPNSYNYEDISDTAVREYYDTQDYGDNKHSSHMYQNESSCTKPPRMFSIQEEVSSQIAAEDVRSEAGDVSECHDLEANALISF